MRKKSKMAAVAATFCFCTMAFSASAAEDGGFTMYYPENMVEEHGETLELEAMPETILALSDSALQVMVRCDVRPAAVTSLASFVQYPDWVSELPVIETGMNGMDTESVIAMEPDLVIMGTHLKEDYGTILEEAEIPVYYTSNGPSVTYSEVKAEAIALMKSFGDDEAVAGLEAEFDAVEAKAAAFTAAMEAKDMMILFSCPPSYQQTSQGYLGSMLSFLPFNNLSDTLIDPADRTAPLDQEMLAKLNPEVLFAISPMAASAEDLEASYAEEMQNNPELWENLQAVQNENVIYLPGEYVSSKGLHVIESLDNLISDLAEKFEVEL